MSRRAIAAAAGVFVLSLALASCASTAPDATDTEEPPSSAPAELPEGFGSPAADGEFPRTVTHFGGETKIDAEPTRVAILSTGQLDVTLSLGVVPIAAARADDAGLVPDYLAAEFSSESAEIAKIIDVGTRKEPDFEKLAKAKPDLILANEQGFAEQIDLLNDIAPTVLTEGEGVNWAQDFLIVASALGKLGDAQGIITDIDEQAKTVGETAGEDTFSFVRIQTDRTRIFGSGSFVGSLAERGGLARPESQQFSETSEEISLEQTELVAADWVFFAVPDGDPGDAAPETFVKGLAGGTEGDQIISVNEDPWFLNAGPTAATTVLDDIAEALAD